jgi:hypothetical protein
VSILRAVLVACVASGLAVPSVAFAHQGNPNFLSEVQGLSPSVRGLSVEVLNRDDQLLLRNASGHTVVVDGYANEPYARVRGDGTVEVNTNSEAYYLNRDRFADAPIPRGVDFDKPPVWGPVSKTGRFEWHDHRMHYMGKGRPAQVSDPEKRQKVFDWKVPVEVDGRRGSINGTLLWTPPSKDAPPLGAIFGLAGLVIAGCIVVIVVRRRRADAPAEAREAREAW